MLGKTGEKGTGERLVWAPFQTGSRLSDEGGGVRKVEKGGPVGRKGGIGGPPPTGKGDNQWIQTNTTKLKNYGSLLQG